MARVAEQLVADRVTIVPTLVLHETLSRLDDPAIMQDSSLRMVPDSEISRWDVPGMVGRAGWTATDFSDFRASRPNQDLFVRIYRASGGKVVAGTDAANQLIVPGQSLVRELELLVQAGFSTPTRSSPPRATPPSCSAPTRSARWFLAARPTSSSCPAIRSPTSATCGASSR